MSSVPLTRVLLAYALSAMVEWAIWVAVLVYAFEEGGPAIAGVASIALLLPAALVAPLAGRAADGPRPTRVLLSVYVVQAVAFSATVAMAVLELPPVAVILGAAVAIAGVTYVRPTVAVVVPGLVVRPEELVRANLLTGNADSASVLLGPLAASALLAIEGPALVLGACILLSVTCALLVLPLARAESPRPAAVGTGSESGALWAAVRTMSTRKGSVSLLAVLGFQYALIGGLDLLYVNLAFDVLDLGGPGSGILSAAFGVGAVLGGLASTQLVARAHLARVLIGALVVVALAMGLLGVWTTLAVTLVALPLAGISRSLLDVTGRMLLQRSAPQDAVASVFAVLEVLAGIGILTGSLLVQLLVAVSGTESAVLGVGVLFAIVTVLCAAGLRHADAHADVPVVQIRLLRSVPLFASLPALETEALARRSLLVERADGEALMRQGEPGDQYVVIADGTVEVTIDGRPIRTMGRGEGLGEIALLADIPRTATVVAQGPVSTLVVERSAFLDAVVGHDASADLAWSVARAYHPPLDEQQG
ncbi:MAG: cyclic nucleotide-binding domain-containing protein [Actinobacteria bacterium]|uniref:Unannotated protein n=1 Tax=freshwater metagenome TaxID=449393 RepID=A0A6J6NUL8_9ZZZZ|nr:cyclic nucleotide-binding domain-containing protein [Actinomycetota bacterium]